MPIARYPRLGQPIAAQPLREFLKSHCVTRFDHLDATAWRRLGEDACRELAGQLIRELQQLAPRLLSELADHRLSSGNGAVAIDELELQPRTRNCFARAGIRELPALSNGLTVAEALQLRGFGVGCLVDLMASLEANRTQRTRRGHARSNHKGAGEAVVIVTMSDLPPKDQKLLAQIGSIPGALDITRQDPRLGAQLRSVALDALCLGDVIKSFRRVGLSRTAADNLVELCSDVAGMTRKSVITEVTDILGAGQRPREREIVEACLQFGEQLRRPTYRFIGKRFRYSGERIRQIFCRHHWRPGQPLPFAPAIDRALEAVRAFGPSWAEDVERQLASDKVLFPLMRLEILHGLASMLGREAGFIVHGNEQMRLLVPASAFQAIQKVQNDARALVDRFGLTTIKRVIDKQRAGRICHDDAVRAICSLAGFYWLNESEGSFSLRARRANVLWHRIRKVLAVAPRVSLDTLWKALRHDNRPICGGLTASQALDFCRKQPECRVSRNIIFARNPEDPLNVLQGHERQLVSFILEHGPLCRRSKLARLAAEAEIAKPSFDKCINCPAIARYAAGVYGLTGANISASELAAFTSSVTRS